MHCSESTRMADLAQCPPPYKHAEGRSSVLFNSFLPYGAQDRYSSPTSTRAAYGRRLVSEAYRTSLIMSGQVSARTQSTHTQMGRVMRKRVQMKYAISVGPDQPARPRSLIRVYTVRYFIIGTLIIILINTERAIYRGREFMRPHCHDGYVTGLYR
jgi:hypothetical protein